MTEIDILVEAPVWERVPDLEPQIRKAVEAALTAESASTTASRTVSILLADDGGIQELNRQWRGKDKPTNVLSFPALPMPGGVSDPSLGDIALAYETCAREAEDEGKALSDHVMHLVVHGILHLLGYDHDTDHDAEVMEAREVAILATLGIADPYAGAEGGAGE